jgi:hypothetical protein
MPLELYSPKSYVFSCRAGLSGDECLPHEGVRAVCQKGKSGRRQAARGRSGRRGGPLDADLGGGVFKQRIAREGGGKSGGFRTTILFRVGSHSFFAHGFAKSDKANVSAKELKA